jgi:hypothetical protein
MGVSIMEACKWRGKAGCGWLYKAACVLSLVAALSGCVQTPTRARIAPRDTDGGVLLKISENLPISTGMIYWGDSVTVRRMPDAADSSSTCYALHLGLRGEAAGTFLGGALPPGTYEFPTIGATKQSIGACNQRDLLKTNESRFGKFAVTAGKLTYLGVLEHTGGNELYKSYMIPMLASGSVNLAEILHVDFPELERLDIHDPQGWLSHSLPAGQDSASRFAIANSYGLFDPSQTLDGTWIFGSRTGVVRTWSRGQSRAELHDTGRRVSLLATAVLPDGSWLAGGEESTLLRSRDKGASWESVRGNLPFGLIGHVVPLGQDILLTLIDGKEVFVYRGDIESGRWRKLASFQGEFAFWTGLKGTLPQSFLVGDTYLTTLPSKQLAIYRLSTGASEIRSLPGSISEFDAGKDGVLRCICVATIAINPYESHDMGKTWQSSTFSRFMALPAMTDATHGVTWYKSGAFDKPSMAYTEDGQTWKPTLAAPARLRHFFFSRDHKTVYASNEGGLVWASEDNGKHWDSVLHLPLPAGDMGYPW